MIPVGVRVYAESSGSGTLEYRNVLRGKTDFKEFVTNPRSTFFAIKELSHSEVNDWEGVPLHEVDLGYVFSRNELRGIYE